MVGSFLAPKWPILVPFSGIDLQKSNFLLISDILAVGGCWGQPMLLFWKLADETQMVKPPEPTSHHNSRKCLIFLPLRAIYFRLLYYETPCIFNTYFSAIFQSSRSHAIFTLYIQQQRQAKSENNPFHLELDEADSENAVKKVNISCPVLSCHHVHLSVHMYVQMIQLW